MNDQEIDLLKEQVELALITLNRMSINKREELSDVNDIKFVRNILMGQLANLEQILKEANECKKCGFLIFSDTGEECDCGGKDDSSK